MNHLTSSDLSQTLVPRGGSEKTTGGLGIQLILSSLCLRPVSYLMANRPIYLVILLRFLSLAIFEISRGISDLETR